MALRIKSHWHGEEERSLGEIAGALAFISWRLAQEHAINLHGESFVYRDDQQRLDVISEYVIFELQIIDRMAHDVLELDDEERRQLIIPLATKLAELVQDNAEDLLGPGDHKAVFYGKLNERGAEYAEFAYGEDGPSYPFMRHLGYEMQQIMGSEGENRWVIDQVMDKEGPEVDRQLRKAVINLFS